MELLPVAELACYWWHRPRIEETEPFTLDVHYIAPAEPGDLDVPMHYRVEGAPTMLSAPGRPPVQ